MSIMRDGYVEKGIYPSRIPHDLALSVSKRLRVYTLHNSKKAVTAD